MSIRKILCPTDFSSGSAHALRMAAQLSRDYDAELVLVHSWFVPPSAFPQGYTYPAAMIDQVREDAIAGLDSAMREARAQGAKGVSSKLLDGVPWSAICDEAIEDKTYDLIVMATHGRTGAARVLVGSVAETVIRHAPCSVLVVRTTGAVAPFKHVLCPLDFSDDSETALQAAGEIAAHDRASVDLLHVIEMPSTYSEEPLVLSFARAVDQKAIEQLEARAARLEGKAANITKRTRTGRAGAEILATLERDRSIDLVVMGCHGRTGLKRLLIGSVAEKVARHAKCPVFVARARR